MGIRLGIFSTALALAGIVSLGAGAVLYLIDGRLNTSVELLLALAVALLGLFILCNPARVREGLTGRTASYGGNVSVMTIAFLGIAVMVNFLSARHHLRFDLTETKSFTLAPQTVEILQELTEPVRITAFLAGADPRRQGVEDLLKEYAYHSDKIVYELIDPELKPAIARQYGVTASAVLIFERGEKRQEVYAPQEQDITSAILKVSQEEQKVICFLTGHNERDPFSSAPDGYSQARVALERDNYRVESLNMVISGTVPDHCAVVVIAAPRQPLLEEERRYVRGYMLKAGKALIVQEPGSEVDLNKLLEPWNVGLGEGMIIDPDSALLGDVATPAVTQYTYTQITKDLPMTLFPTATFVKKMEGQEELELLQSTVALMQSGESSWAETNLAESRVRYDEGEDTKGPLDIAMTVEAPGALGSEEYKTAKSTVTRLVVIGDSDFAANAFIELLGNQDLFLNAINWLAEEERLISIRPKPPEQRTLYLTASQARWILYSSTIFLPLAVLAVGVVVWWKRR